MGVSAKDLDILARGGLIHDIGKIAVPTTLLNKQGPLTEAEFAVMKEHPRTGARILEPIPSTATDSHRAAAPEWFNGKGIVRNGWPSVDHGDEFWRWESPMDEGTDGAAMSHETPGLTARGAHSSTPGWWSVRGDAERDGRAKADSDRRTDRSV